MRSAVVFVALCLMSLTPGRAQAPVEFAGALDPLAVPGYTGTSISLTPAADEARGKLGSAISSDEKPWSGEVTIGGDKQALYAMVTTDGGVAIVADVNRNGRFESGERIALEPDRSLGDAPGFVAATLRFATPDALLPDYPVRVRIRPQALARVPAASGAKPTAYLQTSYQAFATSTVTIDGAPIQVWLLINSKDFTVNPTKGYQFVDCDGNGTMDTDFTSWEMGYAHGTPPVFHIGSGDRYVSIAGVDTKTRRLTMAARTAADYQRIELRVGATVPDFGFKALDGSTHRLYEYRGKYLLLDFWGTWCGPCVGEIPYLKKAYETYRDKGFEILGMDNELPDVTAEDFAKGLETVKKFVAEKGVTWMQAQTESIKPLYQVRFQVVAWPTAILLDREGRIMSVGRTGRGEPDLRGDALDKTLAAVIK